MSSDALQPRQFPAVGKQPARIATSGAQPSGLPLPKKSGQLFDPSYAGTAGGTNVRGYTSVSGERHVGEVRPNDFEAPHSADYNAAVGAGQGSLFSPDKPPTTPRAPSAGPRNVGMSSGRLRPSVKTGRLFNPENLGSEMPPRTGRTFTTAGGERQHQEYQAEQATPDMDERRPGAGQGEMFNAAGYDRDFQASRPSQPPPIPGLGPRPNQPPGDESLQQRQFHGFNPQHMSNEELVKWHRRSASMRSAGRIMGGGGIAHAVAHATGQHYATTRTVFRDELVRRARAEQRGK